MFNNGKKKKALQELETAQKRYEKAGRKTSEAVENLYVQRKRAVKYIEEAEDWLKRLPGFGAENIKKIADARASIRTFTEAMITEEKARNSIEDPTSKYAGAAFAGTATGAAIATVGPSAAMALATTFGTAATGTAISTLSGVAATNAALAWLGGGALAAGGGGMAAGSAILAMAGPVGIAIGGVAAGVGGIFISRKNNKIAEEATKLRTEMEYKSNRLEALTQKVNHKADEIESKRKELKKIKNVVTPENYADIVSIIIIMCLMINEEFAI